MKTFSAEDILSWGPCNHKLVHTYWGDNEWTPLEALRNLRVDGLNIHDIMWVMYRMLAVSGHAGRIHYYLSERRGFYLEYDENEAQGLLNSKRLLALGEYFWRNSRSHGEDLELLESIILMDNDPR